MTANRKARTNSKMTIASLAATMTLQKPPGHWPVTVRVNGLIIVRFSFYNNNISI